MTKQKNSRDQALADRTCKQISALLMDYVSNRLNPTIKQAFEQHLSICPDCVSFVNTYKKTMAATGARLLAQKNAANRGFSVDFCRTDVALKFPS
jgi:anti-sigma factor RsiW